MRPGPDESLSERLDRVLRSVLFAMAGCHGVALLAGLALNWNYTVYISAGALLLALGGVMLLKSGRAFAGFSLPVLGTLLAVLYAAYRERGVHNIGMVALPTLIILSSLLLDRRFLRFLTGASIAGVWVMSGARRAVLGVPLTGNDLGDLAILTVTMVVASMAGAIFSSEVASQMKSLRESEGFRQRVFESSRVPLVVMDEATLRFVDCNQAAVEIYGLESRGEFLGRTPLDVSDAEQYGGEASAEKIRRHVAETEASGSVQFEWRYRRPDGTLWDARVHLMRFESEGRKYLQFTLQDITEAVRNARALRASEERHQKVANCIPDPIWTLDLNGRVTYMTPSVKRIHGRTVEEVLGESFSLAITPEQEKRTRALMAEELKLAQSPEYDRSRVLTFESQERRKDGTVFPAEVRASLLWSEDGKPAGFVGATRDITERKRAEAERERLQAELAQAQKMESVGRLAGGVAHDFNNHLTVINGFTRLALKQTGEDGTRHHLDEVLKAGDRAAALTLQLLAFSRRQVLVTKRLDLNAVVEGMSPMLEPLLGDEVALEVSAGRGPLLVQADHHQLEQVVMNLAVNARDAMPRGGTLRIGTSLEEGGKSVVLEVRDNGTGMDAATRRQIFEPFFTTKASGRGTGLGLAMVQGIVVQSGGRIEVESEPGAGTRFRIFLPAAGGGEEECEPGREAPAEEGRGTVLVVDDREEVRGYVSAALRDYGYRVLLAEGAAGALRMASEPGGALDLVITDVAMPETCGCELAKQLGEVRPDVPVLFVSGYADPEKIATLTAAPGRAFLAKPFTPSVLAAKVRELLGPQAE